MQCASITSSTSVCICMYIHYALYYSVVVESTGQRKVEAISCSNVEGETAVKLAKLKAKCLEAVSSDLDF